MRNKTFIQITSLVLFVTMCVFVYTNHTMAAFLIGSALMASILISLDLDEKEE